MSSKYSFVIPFMNEEDVLPLLIKRLRRVIDDLDASAEVIFVDDGSKDKSAAIIAKAINANPEMKLIRLSRNFGHQIAVTAGLNKASGEAIIIMDADLQDPPEVVHELIASWKEGNEIVHAQRNRRQGETWFKKKSAMVFYSILKRLSSIDIPRDVGDFRLIDAKVLNAFRQMPERDRFLRGMFSWVGFKQSIVRFDRDEREAGVTKYPLGKMMKLAIDGLVGFSDAPLRLALWMGVLVSVGAISYGLYILIIAMFTDQLVAGWASTVVILSFLSGMNLLISGVIGLYVGRIHNEAKQRPLYFVLEEVEAVIPTPKGKRAHVKG
ncbi:glycosyltransferase family 2 protein [Amylibacter sp. SFDW26]|uniref:glycosyltransferase family 2 protein n=1 Tax=Amylibacter sp. SFDW26 TaxID=2652722 RepID=UPI00126292FC|nr:glycosyltransferase family 2 protein [Amylibacter sp. SFDW26]KAB7613506.1 glycosyltransferase family 2 protein [Amylibacter sp. SFDW26]